MKNFYDVIKKPLISEKSTVLSETSGTYAFHVNVASNKQEIKQAIEKLFKVKVQDLRTAIVHGKYKRSGRFVSKRPNWKKAYVTLKEGQKIEFFQGA